MYIEHFGLKQRAFGSNATGPRVFISPQHVNAIADLGNALASNDTVVIISGRVGVGKTTIVNRVLETVATQRAVARVGRIQLGPDEVLELLLTEFGVIDQPVGTIQRYNAFKQLLSDWAASGTRAFIVVEDAKHIGVDALLELEAMTASDSGDSPGASLLLMGPPDLPEFLNRPELDRLQQRIRRRKVLEPFSLDAVSGYLGHCLRVAGKELDEVLAPQADEMLYRLSAGIPRIINNVCETALIAAAGIKMERLTPSFIETVALEVFGLQPILPPAQRPEPEASQVPIGMPEPAAEDVAVNDAVPADAVEESEAEQDEAEVTGTEAATAADDAGSVEPEEVEEAAASVEETGAPEIAEPEAITEAIVEQEAESLQLAEAEPASAEVAVEPPVVEEAVAAVAEEEVAEAEAAEIAAADDKVAETAETGSSEPEVAESDPAEVEDVEEHVAEPGPVAETKADETKAAAKPHSTPKTPSVTNPNSREKREKVGTAKGRVHELVVESGFAPNVVHSSDTGFIADSAADDKLADDPEATISADDVSPIASEPEASLGKQTAAAVPNEVVERPADAQASTVEDRERFIASLQEDKSPAAVETQPESSDEELTVESTQTQRALILEAEQIKLAESGSHDMSDAPGVKPAEAFDPRNHVPAFDDIPTLSDSMRVEAPDFAAGSPEEKPRELTSKAAGKNDAPAQSPASPRQPAAISADPAAVAELPDEIASAEEVAAVLAEEAAANAVLEVDHALLAELEQQQQAGPANPAPEPVAANNPVAPGSEEKTSATGAETISTDDATALAAALAAANEPVDDATPASPAIATAELQPETAASAVTEPDDQRAEDVDLTEWAEELRKAESLEDISDVMAETLFGSLEMHKVSAEIVTDKKPANDDVDNPVMLELSEIPKAKLNASIPATAAAKTRQQGPKPGLPESKKPAAAAARQKAPAMAGANDAAKSAPATGPIESDIPASRKPLPQQDEPAKKSSLLGIFKRASKN